MISEHILFGLRLVKKRFPNKKYAIVLDEGLILSPDFLFYMAQLVFLFQKDDSIFAISAWNSNGKFVFLIIYVLVDIVMLNFKF